MLAINAPIAAAATVACVATSAGETVLQALAETDRYGIQFTPAALGKIEPQRQYCRSALIAGEIDAETPATLRAFLSSAPLLQRIYLNASGSDAQSAVAAAELIRARKLGTIAPLAVDHGSGPGAVLVQQDLTHLHDLCIGTQTCSCRGVCVALWPGGANRQGSVLSFDGVSDPLLRSFVAQTGLAEPLMAVLAMPFDDGTPLNPLMVRANRNPPLVADNITAICGAEPTQLNQQFAGSQLHFRNEIRRKDAAWRTCRSDMLLAIAFSASPLLER